jgi:hypothetical protein
VAKFCHFAELVGAIIYSPSAGNVSLKSGDILENLSKYKAGDIDHFYQDICSRVALDISKLNNFEHLFGYEHLLVRGF